MKHNHAHQINLAGLLDFHGVEEARQIRRVVLIGCCVNVVLMSMKLIFGYLGHSEALVADGFHSVGDVGTDVIMLTFVGISFRRPSESYSYGYGKFETFAALLVSGILVAASVLISVEAVESIRGYMKGEVLERPDLYTVFVICCAIAGKEFLYRFYRSWGKRTRCNALVSSAWHHRSDSFSSLATLVGVSLAHFMGEDWRVLDPICSLVIVVFILIPAFSLFFPAFRELMDGSLGKHYVHEAEEIVSGVKGVKGIFAMRSRKSGPFLIFDPIVKVSGSLTIEEGDLIASEIEHALIHKFGKNIRVGVMLKPEG